MPARGELAQQRAERVQMTDGRRGVGQHYRHRPPRPRSASRPIRSRGGNEWIEGIEYSAFLSVRAISRWCSMNSVKTQELVVLLDDAGRSIGTAPKSQVHHGGTPLHLAFSCYLFDDAGRVLLTRRALDKRAFPGIWTNSFCGHPAPGESLDDAVVRRARDELGVDVVRCALCAARFSLPRDRCRRRRRERGVSGVLRSRRRFRDRRPERDHGHRVGGVGSAACGRASFRGPSARGPSSRSHCWMRRASGGGIRTSARKDVRRRPGRHATAWSPRSPSEI